jgi:hypothetical protein
MGFRTSWRGVRLGTKNDFAWRRLESLSGRTPSDSNTILQIILRMTMLLEQKTMLLGHEPKLFL